MYYKIFQPAPQLKPFIRYYWILRGIDQGNAGTNDLLIPDGCTEIIFNDSSVYARTDVTSGQELSINESCVVGQRNKSILARRIGHTHLVGVKLSAGALNLLSGIPESEFRNLSIALEGLKKTWLTELEERVFEQDSEAQNDKSVKLLLFKADSMETGGMTYSLARQSAGIFSELN